MDTTKGEAPIFMSTNGKSSELKEKIQAVKYSMLKHTTAHNWCRSVMSAPTNEVMVEVDREANVIDYIIVRPCVCKVLMRVITVYLHLPKNPKTTRVMQQHL